MTSKKDYIREMENALQKWAERLEELSVEAKTAKPERQQEVRSLMDAIVENKNFIQLQLKEIKKSDDNWLNLRESIESAAKNLDNSYRSALAYIM